MGDDKDTAFEHRMRTGVEGGLAAAITGGALLLGATQCDDAGTKTFVKNTGTVFLIGGMVLAITLKNLLDSEDFLEFKERYADKAPTFFALDETAQRGGIRLLANQLNTGDVAPPTGIPDTEEGKATAVATLLESFANNKAQVIAARTLEASERSRGSASRA
jgi:hypothetical protein